MQIELTTEQIRMMQKIQLEMLLEVDRICKKENIKYGIDGGTLLGAVRHKGFIPWDPDIDVIMLREEYEKFFVAAKREMDVERFFLQEERTDPEYRWGFTKIRRNGTKFIRSGQEHLKMHTGVFIDILIMDNVPDCFLLRELHRGFCAGCRFVMWSEIGKNEEKNPIKRIGYKAANHIPLSFVFRQLKWMRDRCNRKRSRLVRYMTCRYTYNKKLRGIERKFFDNYGEYQFEGHFFPGFYEYDEYLTVLYGNYMELPPLEKRKSHMPLSELELKGGTEL